MALIVSSIMLILHADSTASLILQKNGVSMMLFNWNLERRAWSQQHSRTGGRPELQQQSRQQRRRHGSSTGLQMMEELICDVAIVGGGPAGCTCALYTSRADLKTIILDKNPAVGALAITSHIANYPGVDRSMSGAELLEQMKVQAIQYGTEYYDRAQVFLIDIEDEGDGSNSNELHNKVVYTPDYKVKARALVLATGAMGRSLPFLPGEEEFLGSGVSYCATCDGAFYRGSEVAVYGATREAMDEALFLTKFASTVHWITPTDVLSCLERNKIMKKVECNANFDEEGYQALTAQPNVKHWNKARILNVLGDASGVTGVTIKGILGEDGEQQEQVIPVEGAFIYGAGGGSKPITEFCQGKVELDESGGVVVDRDTLETSVKGVFAIGDIRNTAYKQVVVAAADGCIAAMSIEKFLKGRNRVKVDWIHK
ncbi:hypothetical protein ACA910_017662 [Epithemia clementina (nom. ined.)]